MFAKTSVSLTTIAVALMGSTAAFAADANAFGERLKAVAAEQNMTVGYGSATSEGDDVILKAMTFSPKGEEPAQLGDITFEDVTGSTEEGWKVARVPIADIDVTEGDSHTVATGMSIEGVELLPADRSSQPPAKQFSAFYFDKAGIEKLTVEKAGAKVFALSNASVDNTVNDDDTFSSDFNFGTFDADFTKADPETAKTMTDLGYGTLGGAIEGSASWDPKTGTLSLDPFDINVENAGNLSFTYEMAGYTPNFIQSMQQISQQMADNPEANQNAGMAMMGLMSQLSLGSADITFTDDSLTGKLLDYYSKQQGMTPQQLISQVEAMVPAALAQLQNPEFQKQATDAVSTFLKDPKSLSVSIDPETPVPAMQIMGAAMGAPQTLPQVLSLQVTANDATED
ncbi:hypothetical protein [Aurantimonas sp. 22II-16-19i]|uniref:hypothetical protein n=1 Tax=Aurantimonas sp. 22II-16-19i TaxID=1317114 RepID=UPI0009F7D0B4|nr:hypothetical protein [Aurantimonas sp. 22II-16-19i]ORE97388.1 hypothetical protein ATO4_08717 [Aurantimonas sp. 22II-16-19i]